MNLMKKYLEIARDGSKSDFHNTPKTSVKSVKVPLGGKQDLDHFFTSEVLPRLASLHKAGRLPDLATCPLWREVDRLWGVPAPDVEVVKRKMAAALAVYEEPDTLF